MFYSKINISQILSNIDFNILVGNSYTKGPYLYEPIRWNNPHHV